MARGEKCKVTTDLVAGTNTYTFGDGTERVSRPVDATEHLKLQFLMHGDKQKRTDKFANCPTVAECVAAWDSLDATLAAGEWSQRGGPGEPRVSELAEAIATIKGWSLEKVIAKLKEMSAEQKAKYRAMPQVASEIESIKLRKQREREKAARQRAKQAETVGDEFDEFELDEEAAE